MDFNYVEEGKEKCAAVREKAKAIVELVSDNELLRSERDKARSYRDKMIGMSSVDSYGNTDRYGGGGSGGGISSSGLSGFGSDSYQNNTKDISTTHMTATLEGSATTRMWSRSALMK